MVADCPPLTPPHHLAGGPSAAGPPARTAALRGLLLHGSALLAGLSAAVGPDAARWFGVRGPHCPLGACLGHDACPGCGLVRSVATALQGEPGAALALHPAGPVVALLLLGGLLLHLDVLRRGRENSAHARLRRRGRHLLLLALLAGWLARMLT